MERHKCKLCSRTFANGRALGGHMKAHLATLPLPPKPHLQPRFLPDTSASFSSSYSSSSSSESEQEEEEEEETPAVELQRESEEKALITNYGLRENPKKSFRLADPEFSFPADTAGSVVVQDRESETESKNPTRRRSKRSRKSIVMTHLHNNTMETEPNNKKKPKLSFMESPPTTTTEPAEPVSSVSNTSPEEDVAMCLVLLSRDKWNRRSVVVEEEEKPKVLEEEEEMKLVKKKVRGGKQNQCEKCGKRFRSSGALGSHKSICFSDEAGANDKVFECPFCSKVFGSGQALGGHKRSHLIMPSSTSNNANNHSHSHSARLNLKESLFIDLNLPAPPEEDNLSVVSDA